MSHYEKKGNHMRQSTAAGKKKLAERAESKSAAMRKMQESELRESAKKRGAVNAIGNTMSAVSRRKAEKDAMDEADRKKQEKDLREYAKKRGAVNAIGNLSNRMKK